MEELIKILKLSEQDLKKYLYDYLLSKQMNPIFEDGFVYAKGKIPILLVAHMDTVFETPPENITYDTINDKLFSPLSGLGGDDRCGVYAIMKILDEYQPHVLFTETEEQGGIGAKKAIQKLPRPDVKYLLEFDRHGSNDCVFYECGNQQFINYVESFDFKTEYGIFSDIAILGPAWDIASVNISSGYYHEHTYSEYIKFNELLHNIDRVKKMLKQHRQAKYFDHQEVKYPEYTSNVDYSSLFSREYDLLWEIFDYPVNTKKRTLNK